MKLRKSIGGGVGATLCLALAMPASGWAQAARASVPKVETEIEEITVTAQKREENLQEVPISVTALTTQALTEKGATTVLDLTQTVPSLQVVTSTNGASNFGIAMRGPSQANATLAQNSKMGLYVDGVYIAKLLGNNMDLEDLERVEVLRGPQGTLFGRNTISGAVQLVTRRPTEDRSITASTEVGNFSAFKGRLTVNVPLVGKNGFWQSDVLGTISIRENVVYKSHDPYYTNVAPTGLPTSGGAGTSNLNRIFNWTSVRWQPTRELTIDYSFEYHRYREAPTGFQNVGGIPGTRVAAPGAFDLRPYVRTDREDSIGLNAILGTDLTRPPRRFSDDGNNKIHVLTGQWDMGEVGPLGTLTLKSINHGRQQFTVGDLDMDGSPIHIADFRRHGNVETWSTEEQLLGSMPRIQYVVGLYYYGEHTTQEDETVLFGGGPGGLNTNGFNSNWADSYAAFGQATWTPPILWDKLSITGGVRYNQDHIHTTRSFFCNNAGYGRNGANVCNLPPPSSIPNLNNFRRAFGADFGGPDAITYTGDLSYQWTDGIMTYFRASRGWQSGYINADATDPSLMNIVRPEKLLTYEIGAKTQLLDNRVRLNADAYYSDYTDQVVNTFRSGSNTGVQAVIQNAGKSQFWGVEFEGTAIPFRGLIVDASYTYTDAMYTEFLEQEFDAIGNPTVTRNVASIRRVNLTPPHKLGLGVTYTAPPTSVGVFSVHTDAFWSDEQNLFTQPRAGGAGYRNITGSSYALVNARVQFVEIPLQKGTLDLFAFGKNLSDTKYRTFAIDFGDSLGWQGVTFGAPRTFGIGLTYNFSES